MAHLSYVSHLLKLWSGADPLLPQGEDPQGVDPLFAQGADPLFAQGADPHEWIPSCLREKTPREWIHSLCRERTPMNGSPLGLGSGPLLVLGRGSPGIRYPLGSGKGPPGIIVFIRLPCCSIPNAWMILKVKAMISPTKEIGEVKKNPQNHATEGHQNTDLTSVNLDQIEKGVKLVTGTEDKSSH